MRAFENSGGHWFFRRPDGYVAMDTSRPMPASIETKTWAAIPVVFPRTPGEAQTGRVASGGIEFRTVTPAYSAKVAAVDLGAFTGSAAPTIYFAKAKIRRTPTPGTSAPDGDFGGGNATGRLEAPLAVDETVQWPGGSLLLEHFGQSNKIWLWRHLDFGVEAGRWVLNLWQGNDAYTTAYTYTPLHASTESSFELDLTINWGVFR